MNSVQTDSLKAILEHAACCFSYVPLAPRETREPPGNFHTGCHWVRLGQHVSESALSNQNTVGGSLDGP
ncbi:hypothetical protein DM39_5848 [Burkholderia cenocepacia]|uniref:Uncharacterized protein n=1 Tax=Burkholderia cenocepacia TaxID=95486 RepID=A0AAN0RVZ7_9BURK|nr:hypothetical protein DM39_5848 [Burkholderia cenocepacia]